MIYPIILPHTIRFGEGSLSMLADETRRLGAKRALIVTDPGVYRTGIVDSVRKHLSQGELTVEVFPEVEPEPKLHNLNVAAKELRRGNYDVLVGLGGGSSIDTVKGLSVLLAHGGNGQNYVGVDNIPGPGIPFFALPTTAGTGSEVTNIAIFDDPEKKIKMGMVSPHLLARLALVDPSLTYDCPPSITAASGIDALIHAIEGYTSIKANNFTDALALKAMQLIVSSLRTVVSDGSNKEARNCMAEGSFFAGIVLGNAGVSATHALAYALGSRFHISHGVANGLLMPYVMKCNLTVTPSKYAVVAKMLEVEIEGLSLQDAAEQGVEAFKALASDIGIPLHLRELNVTKGALKEMAMATMDVTRLLSNNSKKLTFDDVRNIWESAW